MLATAEKMDAGELHTGSQRLRQAVTQITSACVLLGKANCMGMHKFKVAEKTQKQREPGDMGERVHHHVHTAC